MSLAFADGGVGYEGTCVGNLVVYDLTSLRPWRAVDRPIRRQRREVEKVYLLGHEPSVVTGVPSRAALRIGHAIVPLGRLPGGGYQVFWDYAHRESQDSDRPSFVDEVARDNVIKPRQP